MAFVFADVEIDCARRELRRTGVVTPVQPQVFDVLVHLLRHRDRVVSKEELIRVVWEGPRAAIHSNRDPPRIPLRRGGP